MKDTKKIGEGWYKVGKDGKQANGRGVSGSQRKGGIRSHIAGVFVVCCVKKLRNVSR